MVMMFVGLFVRVYVVFGVGVAIIVIVDKRFKAARTAVLNKQIKAPKTDDSLLH